MDICFHPSMCIVDPFWNCHPFTEQDSKHNEACKCGVARMAIKTGDIRRLVNIYVLFVM